MDVNNQNNNTNKPETVTGTTIKDFFFQIGIIVGLYISAGSLIALLFQLINYTFPDELSYYNDPYSTGMRIAIASLIVIFPLFLTLGHFLQKDYKIHPEKRSFTIRRFLVSLTLFVAIALIVGDLVALINVFLGGEITIRFILKVLTIIVVAGLVFGYYFMDYKRPDLSSKNLKMFASIATALVLGSMVLGFLVMGSPITQRLLRLDQNKINDLQYIQDQIVHFWRGKEKLPRNLKEMEDPLSGFVVPIDEQTEKDYEYQVMGPRTFKLCAEFNLESRDIKIGQGSLIYRPLPAGDIFGQGNWEHGEGRECFERKIDPNLYPPYK